MTTRRRLAFVLPLALAAGVVTGSAGRQASVVYHLATRDDLLPRFASGAMPAVPARGRGAGQ